MIATDVIIRGVRLLGIGAAAHRLPTESGWPQLDSSTWRVPRVAVASPAWSRICEQVTASSVITLVS